jgi:hypothetical protein
MSTAARVALAALACLVAGLLLADTPPAVPGDPHAPLLAETACPGCHDTSGGSVDPHGFVVPIVEACTGCHGLDRIGRSHPYGVNPRQSHLRIAVPRELPLESGCISCGTCHQPHAAWAAPVRSFPGQEPVRVAGQDLYRTYMLRIPATVDAGFTALCQACHRDR